MQKNITHLLMVIDETNQVTYCTYNQDKDSLWVNIKFTQTDLPVLSFEEDITTVLKKLNEYVDLKNRPAPTVSHNMQWGNERMLYPDPTPFDQETYRDFMQWRKDKYWKNVQAQLDEEKKPICLC